MKSIEELVKQQPVYMNDWEGDGKITVLGAFFDIYLNEKDYLAPEAPYANVAHWLEKKALMDKVLDEHKNETILFATYTYENYEGSAWVLFYNEEDGKLYEVNGSHCSCYGLEGQWEPEETTLDALALRLKEGKLGEYNHFDVALKQFLGA